MSGFNPPDKIQLLDNGTYAISEFASKSSICYAIVRFQDKAEKVGVQIGELVVHWDCFGEVFVYIQMVLRSGELATCPGESDRHVGRLNPNRSQVELCAVRTLEALGASEEMSYHVSFTFGPKASMEAASHDEPPGVLVQPIVY